MRMRMADVRFIGCKEVSTSFQLCTQLLVQRLGRLLRTVQASLFAAYAWMWSAWMWSA
jgi:hypothetical protein